MANRKDFMISKLIDIVLSWTDDINLAIQEMIDEGIQPNELLDYFDANIIVEALSDNETPPEIAAVTEQEKAKEIFDNADTLPEKSELIEENKQNKKTDLENFIDLLKKFAENMPLTFKVTDDDYHSVIYIRDDDGDTNEWQFNKETGKYYGMYTYEKDFEDFLSRRNISLDN